MFNSDGNIIYSNETCCGSLGKKRELLLNTHQKPQHHYSTADEASTIGSNVSGVSFNANVNIKYIAKGSHKELLAIAFVATLRAFESIKRSQHSYTINALHNLTGVHAKTIEKRIATLQRMGLVIFENNGKYTFLSVKSKHSEHNIKVEVKVSKKTLKSAEKSILQERFINKLRQIDYYRNAISRYKDFKDNPNSKVTLDEFKKLNLWLRSHCKTDYRNGEFIDYGWSYKNIADYLFVSVKSAVEIVKKVVESGKVKKKNNFMFKKISSKYEVDYIQHTFTYHGYSYKIWANSYTLADAVCTGIISL